MITEDALYTVFNTAITAAVGGDALFGSGLFSSTRGSASEDDKTIRLQTFNGLLNPTSETQLKEQRVEFVVQCLAKALDVGLSAEQAAQTKADAMLKASFNLLINNPTLSGAVCDISFFDGEKNYDRLVIDIGATKYGSAYLYGTINP